MSSCLVVKILILDTLIAATCGSKPRVPRTNLLGYATRWKLLLQDCRAKSVPSALNLSD